VTNGQYVLKPIGRVESTLTDPAAAPMQGDEGAPSTRSQDRPNPIGLHRVEIAAVDGTRIRVRNLEAIDGTPVLDVKPVLRPGTER
jgi:tRNA (Thr-GGU) A37 N-methylase